MKHYATTLVLLAASCTYAPAFAEKTYKEVTCVTITQAQTLLNKFKAKHIFSFQSDNGYVLIVESGVDDVVVFEFLPSDNMACLILDGKKHKGA